MTADPNALKNVFNLSFKKKKISICLVRFCYMVYSVVWNPCWLWWLLLLCIFKSTPRSGFSIILLCGMQTAWALHWEAPSHMSDSLTPVSLWKRPAWYYFWTCMEQNLVFKLQLGLLLSNCSLECGVYFIKCCDFFIEGKGSQMFFDESAATVFLSLKLCWKHQASTNFSLMNTVQAVAISILKPCQFCFWDVKGLK